MKAAFREAALKWHPDRHATSSEATKAEAATRFKVGASPGMACWFGEGSSTDVLPSCIRLLLVLGCRP